jgi:hypothetical protein
MYERGDLLDHAKFKDSLREELGAELYDAIFGEFDAVEAESIRAGGNRGILYKTELNFETSYVIHPNGNRLSILCKNEQNLNTTYIPIENERLRDMKKRSDRLLVSEKFITEWFSL